VTDRSPPVLEVRDLVVTFGGVRALDGVDLTVDADSLRAVIGPNGCGKTTVFNVITGVLRPRSGSVRFEGRSIPGLGPHRIARAGIVRKFQVPTVFAGLTVIQNVTVAGAASSNASGERTADLLDLAGLQHRAGDDAGTLSHGEKQWLELAMVLATAPRLVLLDEPAAGMTRAEKTRTVAMLAEMRRRTRAALVVIEHDMGFVEALACPVSVMMAGRIVAEGSLADVRRVPTVIDGYLGRRAALHG
jgi:ABC-type uncharacterized transport system ATPase subunit